MLPPVFPTKAAVKVLVPMNFVFHVTTQSVLPHAAIGDDAAIARPAVSAIPATAALCEH